MENYSRSNKNKTKSSKKPTKQHIKTGLSAFQKTIATVASILSIIIASITIMNLTGHKDEKSKTDTSSSTATTTIIKEIEKDRIVLKPYLLKNR